MVRGIPLFLLGLASSPSLAQSGLPEHPKHRFRAEIKAGVDRSTLLTRSSFGNVEGQVKSVRTDASYGGELGYDVRIGHATAGAYVGVERYKDIGCVTTPSTSTCYPGGANLTLGAMAGYNVARRIQVFVRGGYSRASIEVKDRSLSNSGSDRCGLDGYHVGGGLSFDVARSFYVKGLYDFTAYNSSNQIFTLDSTSLNQATKPKRKNFSIALGARF